MLLRPDSDASIFTVRHFMGYITKMNTALQSLEGTRWSWLTNLQPER